jgi:hypothetical protein
VDGGRETRGIALEARRTAATPGARRLPLIKFDRWGNVEPIPRRLLEPLLERPPLFILLPMVRG